MGGRQLIILSNYHLVDLNGAVVFHRGDFLAQLLLPFPGVDLIGQRCFHMINFLLLSFEVAAWALVFRAEMGFNVRFPFTFLLGNPEPFLYKLLIQTVVSRLHLLKFRHFV